MGQSRQIYFLSLVAMTIMTGFGIIFPIFPKFLEHFGGGVWELGILTAAWALSATLFSPLLGSFADRYGRRLVIIISLVGYSFSNIGFLVSKSFIHLLIFRFLEGSFSAGINPAAIALASELSEEEERAQAIGIVTAGSSIGIVVGPMVGGFLFALIPSFEIPFLVSASFGLIGVAFAFYLLEESKVIQKNQNLAAKRFSFSQIYSKIPKPFFAFSAYLLVTIFSVSSWMLIEPSFSFYIYDDLNLEPYHFGVFVSVYGVMVAIGQGLLGGLSDRYGRKPVIFIGAMINATFYVMMVYAKTFFLLNIAAIVAGIGLGLMNPALNALITEVTNEENHGLVLGIGNSAIALSQIVAPLIGSFYYEHASGDPMTTLFWISAIMGGISTIMTMFLNFRKETAFKTEIKDYPQIPVLGD
ncbi:MAG: MFS transporter [Methanobacteriota archaeon]|nr:MAG: MFS transporter [Euryarchaeota archaeon]